ncbi:MAG TPA: META domain-containing protein [Allosphingosinicella sp.]
MNRFFALFLVAALGGCAPAAQDEAEPDLKHRARPIILGSPGPNGVPQWSAVIVPGRLLLDSPTSAGWYSLPLPSPVEETAPRRLTYAGDRITLVGEIGACDIPEYRELLPNRFTLSWDGGNFVGCNGRGILPVKMAGTVWELVRIGTEKAPEGLSPAATLLWGESGSLGGTLACNDGGIKTRWAPRGRFVPGPPGFEQTAMGCNDPEASAFGARFWDRLATARSWNHAGDRLWIVFADGTEAELRFLLPTRIASLAGQ